MLRNIRKIKPYLYPAAFILIAGFAFVYKTALKGNADYFLSTYRSGKQTAVTAVRTPDASGTVTEKTASEASAAAPSSETVMTVQVYICGAVNKPGVYSVIRGTILNDAVEKAGGFTADAAVTSMNLVYEINSNMSFYIPTVKEVESGNAQDAGVIRGKDDFIWGSEDGASQSKTSGKVNINTDNSRKAARTRVRPLFQSEIKENRINGNGAPLPRRVADDLHEKTRDDRQHVEKHRERRRAQQQHE